MSHQSEEQVWRPPAHEIPHSLHSYRYNPHQSYNCHFQSHVPTSKGDGYPLLKCRPQWPKQQVGKLRQRIPAGLEPCQPLEIHMGCSPGDILCSFFSLPILAPIPHPSSSMCCGFQHEWRSLAQIKDTLSARSICRL